jgi:hypothetical protein
MPQSSRRYASIGNAATQLTIDFRPVPELGNDTVTAPAAMAQATHQIEYSRVKAQGRENDMPHTLTNYNASQKRT